MREIGSGGIYLFREWPMSRITLLRGMAGRIGLLRNPPAQGIDPSRSTAFTN
ncbi:hypothetical protein [Paenibacillus sp. IHBB 3054]|uniref:hypothetical protein n=1 Tax=Paenibacillus sp. IHBB 3054 TaxID=3425689 RepID=UPI003F678A79